MSNDSTTADKKCPFGLLSIVKICLGIVFIAITVLSVYFIFQLLNDFYGTIKTIITAVNSEIPSCDSLPFQFCRYNCATSTPPLSVYILFYSVFFALIVAFMAFILLFVWLLGRGIKYMTKLCLLKELNSISDKEKLMKKYCDTLVEL